MAIYAFIDSNNLVDNLIIIDPRNAVQDFPSAIPTDGAGVALGDTYNPEDKRFYHNGVMLQTTAEKYYDVQCAEGIDTALAILYGIIPEEEDSTDESTTT